VILDDVDLGGLCIFFFFFFFFLFVPSSRDSIVDDVLTDHCC
jgi:hypothetical protein